MDGDDFLATLLVRSRGDLYRVHTVQVQYALIWPSWLGFGPLIYLLLIHDYDYTVLPYIHTQTIRIIIIVSIPLLISVRFSRPTTSACATYVGQSGQVGVGQTRY
jgi:hypothetical protein